MGNVKSLKTKFLVILLPFFILSFIIFLVVSYKICNEELVGTAD